MLLLIWINICVCVCMSDPNTETHTHTSQLRPWLACVGGLQCQAPWSVLVTRVLTSSTLGASGDYDCWLETQWWTKPKRLLLTAPALALLSVEHLTWQTTTENCFKFQTCRVVNCCETSSRSSKWILYSILSPMLQV